MDPRDLSFLSPPVLGQASRKQGSHPPLQKALEESLRKAVGQFLRAHGATHSGLPSTCKPQAWGWGREKEL